MIGLGRFSFAAAAAFVCLTGIFGGYTAYAGTAADTDSGFAGAGHAAGDTVRILAIGNSFSQDAVEQNLYELAAEDGIPLIIGNAYIAGCSLERHVLNSRDDKKAYSYRKIDGNGKKVTDKVSLSEILADEEWDYVSFQQSSPYSGQYETYKAWLPELYGYVAERVPDDAKFLMHQTWAYAADSKHKGFANYGNDQMTMYSAIVKANKKAAKLVGIQTIVPSGTAVQNARTSLIGDRMCRDGYHLNVVWGRYTAACAWYETLFGNVSDNEYAPEGMNVIYREACQEAAADAVRQPFKVTAAEKCAAPADKNISGRVTCDGKGIEGVVVSDGRTTTVTGKNGKYTMTADKDSRFVFISTPSGYSSPVEDNVVKFFIPVEESGSGYDFTLTKKKNDDTRHNLVVISDQQVYDSTEFSLLERAALDIRETVESAGDVETVGICCGDIVSFNHSLYDGINATLAKSGITFRCTLGNHDMRTYTRSFERSTDLYENVYGPAYYSFNVGKVHYVMLNDNFFIGRDYFYIGYLPERQLSWLEEDLSHVPAGSTVVVAMHIPTTLSSEDRKRFDYNDIEPCLANKQALYDILKPFNAQIVSGHIHTSCNQVIGKRLFEHNVAALSGAWWCGPICTDGTPAGYKVFEIAGDDIKWSYKSVGYGKDMQMKVYYGKEFTEYGGHVTANVWDWDPEWKVEYYEDGKKVCDMEQFKSIDHEAAECYRDRSKLKHQYVWPTPCEHLFRAMPTGNAKLGEVRVTDRFGRTFSATIDFTEMSISSGL